MESSLIVSFNNNLWWNFLCFLLSIRLNHVWCDLLGSYSISWGLLAFIPTILIGSLATCSFSQSIL